MDKIIIKDLDVYGYVGVYGEEKHLGQKFLISLEIGTDFKECIEDDNINKTINYGEICKLISKEFVDNKFNLLEKSSDYLCKLLLTSYQNISYVEIEIKKPWAPIGLSLDHAGVKTMRKWNDVYIAFGSNMGDKEYNIKAALDKIQDEYTKIVSVSKLINTKPLGYLEQDDFLNGACEVKTLLEPTELLRKLMKIELELKRERVIKWGPRTIDLDIIFFNDYIINLKDLVIPHPSMEKRLFVLEPLCEIAPYKVHPLLNKKVIDLMDNLS